MQGGNELKEAYNKTNRDAKVSAEKAKNEAYEEWHEHMGSEEWQRWQIKGQHVISKDQVWRG